MKFKRGMIEVQFNWIFVLVIGAVILTLFAGIIIRQKGISETSKDFLILNNLDTILSGTEASTGTVNIIKIPYSRIEFDCERNGAFTYSIGSQSKQLDIVNTFAPSILEDNRLLSMTLDFSMPYRVSNLVYLTSPKYRYIFIGNNQLKRDIKKLMPNESLIGDYTNLNDVIFRSEAKARFLFFDGSINDNDPIPVKYENYKDEAISALKIDGNPDTGTLTFYEKSGKQFKEVQTSHYLGQETLLGAVFADDIGVYTCVMDNIFEKINIVTQIYKKKTESINILGIGAPVSKMMLINWTT